MNMETTMAGATLPQPWTGHRSVVPVDDDFVASVREGMAVEYAVAPSDEAPREIGRLVQDRPGVFMWHRVSLDGSAIGTQEVYADDVAELVRRLSAPELLTGATEADPQAWALFDGVAHVMAPLLDFVGTPETLSIAAELEATLAIMATVDGVAKFVLAAKVRGLTARIERRRNLQPVRLQNRDRSTAASIAQVQSIGKNPDPDLLGYNKTPTEGAPIVFADYDELEIPRGQLGRKATVTFTKDMSKVPVQFAVVAAGDVMVSHDFNGMPVAGYDAMEAPAGKLRAVAGNGRAAGIQLAYAKGTAGKYVQGLIDESDLLGLDPDAIGALADPMLVRIMRHEDVTADIGDKTNSSGMAGFSAVEQAKTDAERVDIANLAFNEDGTPTLESLTRFVQAMPVSEQAALAPDGSPTNQALDRLMAATFSRAYQNDDLVKLYSQSLDPEIKNVLFGMAQAAGDMAALEGHGDYDIRGFVTDAANMASNAKRAGMPLSRMAEQRDMGVAEESNDIAAMFARNVRSAKKIGDALRKLARAALHEAESEAEDMFGPVEKRTPSVLVAEHVLDSVAGAGAVSAIEKARKAARISAAVKALQVEGLDPLQRAKAAAELARLVGAGSGRLGPVQPNATGHEYRELLEPTKLYRSVSPEEWDSIQATGEVRGGGSKFNAWEKRGDVFFGDALDKNLIGQAEDKTRRVDHAINAGPLGDEFAVAAKALGEAERAMDARAVELGAADAESLDGFQRRRDPQMVKLRAAAQAANVAMSDVQQRARAEGEKVRAGITAADAERGYTSVVLETKPLAGARVYEGKHSGYSGLYEYGFDPGVVKLADIVKVHYIASGEALRTEDVAVATEPVAAPSPRDGLTVKRENLGPLEGTVTHVTFPDGVKRTIQRMNSASTMGLPGWHDTSDDTHGGYLGDTKDEAIGELRRRHEAGNFVDSAPAARHAETTSVKQTDTPEFKAWFGGSKVVDAQGQPLVAYHGTSGDFSVFETNGDLRGAWFTVNADDAGMYAVDRTERANRAEFFKKYPNADQVDRAFGSAAAKVFPVYLSIQNPLYVEVGDIEGSAGMAIVDDEYDGIIVGDFEEIVVRNPSQIKSATGNSGAFDPKSGSILDSQATEN